MSKETKGLEKVLEEAKKINFSGEWEDFQGVIPKQHFQQLNCILECSVSAGSQFSIRRIDGWLTKNFVPISFITKTYHTAQQEPLEELSSILDDDSCECYNCNRTRNFLKNRVKEKNRWRQKITSRAQQDLKEELREKIEKKTRKEYYSERGFHEMNGRNKVIQEILNLLN